MGLLPVLGGIAGGVGGFFLGGPAGAAGGAVLGAGVGDQMDTNARNIELAREFRDWQGMMANTAYRRAMADMKAAGLNPILAGKLGGAETPSVSAPQMEAVTPKAVASAQGMMGLQNQIQKTQSDIGVNQTTMELQNAQKIQAAANARQAESQAQLNMAKTPYEKTWSKAYEDIGKLYDSIGGAVGTAKRNAPAILRNMVDTSKKTNVRIYPSR